MLVYAAIRDVDGEELPSPMSIASAKRDVEKHCQEVRRTTPEWDKEYPVVRIARFQCKEI